MCILIRFLSIYVHLERERKRTRSGVVSRKILNNTFDKHLYFSKSKVYAIAIEVRFKYSNKPAFKETLELSVGYFYERNKLLFSSIDITLKKEKKGSIAF